MDRPNVVSRLSASLEEECHIASLLVWSQNITDLRADLVQMPGVECPLPVEGSKCVVVLEAATAKALLAHIEAIRAMPAVMNAQLVYHAVDQLEIEC